MTSEPSMYERALGERFGLLPPAVQRFHRLRGHWTLTGQAHTQAPSSGLAHLLAWALGTPRRATAGALRFELQAQPACETWTRHYPAQTMRSKLRLVGTEVHEQLGLCCLRFRLLATPQGLEMKLAGVRFLGLPCPRWLLPEVVARETGDGWHLQFDVVARMRGIGQVAAYRGHLDLPDTAGP